MAEIDLTNERGSAVLLKAWQSGMLKLSDEVVTGLSEVLNGIQGRVETARVLGEETKQAVRVEISYDDGDPVCGNDITLLLGRLKNVGGGIPVPIHIIINGIPAFDAVRMTLEVGNVSGGA